MAASVAGRSTLLRTLSRVSAKAAPRRPYSTVASRIPSLITRRTSIAYPPSIRLLRRELSSFKPVHSVIASACLVSKLPTEGIHSSEVLANGTVVLSDAAFTSLFTERRFRWTELTNKRALNLIG